MLTIKLNPNSLSQSWDYKIKPKTSLANMSVQNLIIKGSKLRVISSNGKSIQIQLSHRLKNGLRSHINDDLKSFIENGTTS